MQDQINKAIRAFIKDAVNNFGIPMSDLVTITESLQNTRHLQDDQFDTIAEVDFVSDLQVE